MERTGGEGDPVGERRLRPVRCLGWGGLEAVAQQGNRNRKGWHVPLIPLSVYRLHVCGCDPHRIKALSLGLNALVHGSQQPIAAFHEFSPGLL